jgi:hypothetical protein
MSETQVLHPYKTISKIIVLYILILCLGLPGGIFPSGFPPITYLHSSTHSCYMSCPSHHLWLDYSNYTLTVFIKIKISHSTKAKSQLWKLITNHRSYSAVVHGNTEYTNTVILVKYHNFYL